mmetsp:Transcript_1828/g.3306  ORF Transcript_1828/g.3306 Transcript_1828/m.3306 type:complete len:112 (+) Transcript_1828:150-485(+)
MPCSSGDVAMVLILAVVREVGDCAGEVHSDTLLPKLEPKVSSTIQIRSIDRSMYGSTTQHFATTTASFSSFHCSQIHDIGQKSMSAPTHDSCLPDCASCSFSCSHSPYLRD